MKREIIYIIVSICIIIGVVKALEQEPKIIVKTKIEKVIVHDTIHNFEVIESKPVYITKIKTEKGKDSLIYVLKPSDDTLEAKQYNTLLSSNNAIARLKITSTGELLDVSGTIDYTKEKETVTITKIKAKSGLFLYGDVPISNFNAPEVGLMYQIRNSFLVKGGVQYNPYTNKPDIKVGIGIKIF